MASSSNSSSVLNMIALREQGLLNHNLYKEEIVTTKLDYKPQEQCRIGDETHKVYHFAYMRANDEGNLIGVNLSRSKFFKRTKVISRIYIMDPIYNKTCSKGPCTRDTLVSSVKTKKVFRDSMVIADTTDVNLNGKKPLLFAGNAYKEGIAGLTYFNCAGKNLDFEWRVQGQALCCTSCDYSQQFALGCEDGYYLFNTIHMSEKRELQNENILSVQFSKDGNLLIFSSDERGVTINDVREHACYRRFCAIKREFGSSCRRRHIIYTVSSEIKEMKLLDDQTSLICADEEGYLEKVDIRMMKTVFRYEGHVGHKYRRCLCLNEDLDLICASGGDQLVRIWSLGTGKPKYERPAFYTPYCLMSNEPPHCCFISDQRRWFLALIKDNVVIPIVPTEEFPDLEDYETSMYSYR